MSRRDYYDDPDAPTAQVIVPAVTAFVMNDAGKVLLPCLLADGLATFPADRLAAVIRV